MRRRWQQLDAATQETRDHVLEMERHLDTMKTVLMVREPSSTIAAEAYDGLRKQIVAAMTERIAHLTQLVQLADALSAGVDTTTLTAMTDSWLESAGLVRLTDPSADGSAQVFEMVEDLGGSVECLAPAYVDSTTGRIMRTGRARRRAVSTVADAPEPVAVASTDAPRAGRDTAATERQHSDEGHRS